MLKVEIINAGAAAMRLREAAVRAKRGAPVWQVAAMRLKQSILRNFRVGGWFPGPWRKSYRAQAQGGQTLVDRGILRNSIQARSGSDWAAAGSAQKYAKIHQMGGTIRAKSAKALRFKIGDHWYIRRAVTIPARPFLPVKDGRLHPDDVRFMAQHLGSWVTRAQA